jgi:hypothetical protein
MGEIGTPSRLRFTRKPVLSTLDLRCEENAANKPSKFWSSSNCMFGCSRFLRVGGRGPEGRESRVEERGGSLLLCERNQNGLSSHLTECFFGHEISERMCFEIRFCTGSGRRTSVLKFVKILVSYVGPPVEWNRTTVEDICRSKVNRSPVVCTVPLF